ncbi:hypothetical protein FRX31_032738 [Thalictrum thalictroides]|uniref:Uncharacterized protein n=1 Tax=Thalictrum thalictroides TaxID=46969 RepID=A0A7J6V008_THATH|nr:hypothetical protein FRX31_032738 [Thalictrum thalictroides]
MDHLFEKDILRSMEECKCKQEPDRHVQQGSDRYDSKGINIKVKGIWTYGKMAVTTKVTVGLFL